MDKLIHFKGTTKGSNLQKLGNGMAYYSEDENAESPDGKPQQKQNDKYENAKTCDVRPGGGRAFDFGSLDVKESDNKQKNNNLSKFNQQKGSTSAKQHAGDEDEAEIEDQDKSDKKKKDDKKALDLKAAQKKDLHKRFLQKQGDGKKLDSDLDGKGKGGVVDALKNHPWRHLIFGPTCVDNTFKKHLTLSYRGLVYAKKCLKGPSDKFIKTKQVIVPDSKIPKSRTLLLDLDETLIHSCSLKENPDHIVWAKSEYGEESKIGLKIRPHCLEFLQKMSQLWDIYVFTASSPAYATAIVNFLDPEAKYIIGILNRANCMETKNGFFIKDLRILKNKSLKSMVLVDNLAHSFGFQIENGIPILEWHSDKNDTELKHLMTYLVEAAQVEDVRKFNREKLRLLDLADTKMEDLMI